MKNEISNGKINKGIILNTLKLFVLFITFFIYKYVYNGRVNQEMILKLFIIILITLWIIKLLSVEEIVWNKNKLNLPIFLFIIVLSFSLMISNTVQIRYGDYIIFISYIILYFVIINFINKKKEFDYFVKLFFLTSFIVSLYTLIQYYGFDPYLKDLHSLTSTIGQKNWISNYIGMFFPIALIYFLLENKKRNKIIYFILLSILYVTLMICQSRGIWISICLTAILAIYIIIKFKFYEIFKRNRKWLSYLLVTFLAITIIYSTDNPLNKSAITFPQRAMSTFDEQDPSINARLLMWKTTFEMIKDKPILGSGIGTFKINYLDYQADFIEKNPYYVKYSGNAGEAHNEYLQIWSELGIIGLGIFLLIIFVFYKLVWEFLKKEKDNKKKIMCLGLFLGINCFLIHSLFTFPLHVPTLGSTFFIIFGLTVVYIKDFNLTKIEKKINIKNPLIKIVLNISVLLLMIVAINCMVIKPYIAELYYFKGMRYNVDKNFTKSLPNFQYAVQLDPYNGRIIHALGSTYYHLDIQDEAQNILQKTKKYITDRNTFRNLGLSYMQSGNYQEAEKEFRHAIYLDPKFYNAYNDLASLYIYENEYDKAIRQWERAIELNLEFEEKHIFLYYIGLAYNKKEMPNKALEYFLQALQLAPEGSPIIEEIEEEINKIYKSNLEK
jgi:O-antigen ligase